MTGPDEPGAGLPDSRDPPRSSASLASLQACVRDLMSLIALPAMTSGSDPRKILDRFGEALETLLPIQMCVTTVPSFVEGDATVSVIRVTGEPTAGDDGRWRSFTDGCASVRGSALVVTTENTPCGPLRVVRLAMEYGEEAGSLVVGTRQADFPSLTESAVLRAAASTAAGCLKAARLLHELEEGGRVKDEFLELRKLILEIVSHLTESDATLRSLVAKPEPLLRIARAGGAAVVFDDQCWTTGGTPTPDEILALAGWIGQCGANVHQTDSLARVFAPAARYRESAAGMQAISLSQVHQHLILWFRPEIGGHCSPWAPSDTAVALELRQALLDIVLKRAEERAESATELGRVNQQLEAFSYTVSHDLRAPMRHITSYVDLVLDTDGARLGERSHRYLGQVKEASAFAGQLVDALLDFSRMGRSALKRSVVDTEALVDDLVGELAGLERDRDIKWKIERPLPELWADPFLMQVAVRNLFSNALKYTRGCQTACIRVAGVRPSGGTGLEVSDNGVGFEMKYVAKLFGVFQRLHSAEEFEGTGIGLANVRRIVERHGGATWARGEPRVGATFGFSVPHRPAAEVPPPIEASR